MTTIRARVRIDASRRLTLQLPDDVAPGEHDVTLIVDAAVGEVSDMPRGPLNFPVDDVGPWPGDLFADWPPHDVGPWPEGFTMRREDMYGDDGR